MLSRIKELFKYSIQYACVMHCTFEYVGDFVVCNGPSMEPTLYTNNVLLTERISARLNKYQRGDIIIAISPLTPKQFVCKRIVGTAGDKITTILPTTMRGDVTVVEPNQGTNSEPINNNNNTNKDDSKAIEEFVPRGYIWVEGDNKGNSADSRYYGPIPTGLVKSRVVLRLWPLSKISIL